MNPRLLIALLVVLLAIIVPLAACGGGTEEASTDTETDVLEPVPPAAGEDPTEPDLPVDDLTDTSEDTPAPAPSGGGGKLPQIKVSGPALEQGARGNRVKQLQRALTALGLLDEGSADGSFGKKTKTAVQAFQLGKGLKSDGVAGKQTIRAINKAVKQGETFDTGPGTEDAGAPPAESVDTDTAGDELAEPAPDQVETEPLTPETETTG